MQKKKKKRTKNQSFKSQLFAQRVEGKSSLFFCCQKSESSKFVKKQNHFIFERSYRLVSCLALAFHCWNFKQKCP